LLLENGGNPTIRGWENLTPLAIAQKEGQTEVVNVLKGQQSRHLLAILIISVVSMLFIMLFCLYLRCQNKQMTYHKRAADLERRSKTLDLSLYLEKFKFPQEQLKIGQRIGVGSFGFVFKGRAQGIVVDESETDVTVKMVKGITNNGVRLYE